MNKADVLEFSQNAEEYLHALWHELENGTYRHGHYATFQIRDSKLRTINKACVRDRIVHQAVFSKLEPVFDRGFIFDSYSSRKGKGVLAALERFEDFARTISRQNRRAVWILKCDIRKFFDSVDHDILKKRLAEKVSSPELLNLISEIIGSFETSHGKGIPLGNITSQIFSNIYLDPLDQFMKRNVKAKHYLRYADDIVILTDRKEILFEHLEHLRGFLESWLRVRLYPDKISIRTWRQGADILGYISHPNYRTVRTITKRRMRHGVRAKRWLAREGMIAPEKLQATIASYRGRIKHAWSRELARWVGIE